MEIWVQLREGKIFCFPDPVRVQQGTAVTWRFRAEASVAPRIRWLVYFDHESPFRGQGKQFLTNTVPVGGLHTGTTGAMSADDPGDYKYGVRVVDASSDKLLGDDDPHLVVFAAG